MLFWTFLLLSYFCFSANAQSAANFIIEDSYPCKDVPRQKINLIIKPKTFSHPQVVDVTLITPIPLGNNLKLVADIDLENKLIFKNWEHLITFEDDYCRIKQSYIGALSYDMETAMGVIPRGVCPIPKGNYHAVNYTINFGMLKLQTFPFGKLRVTYKYLEKPNRNLILCTVLIVSNTK